MSCEHPLLAVNLGKFQGKYKIKILPKRADQNLLYLEERYGSDNLMMLPCGSCPSCKASHKKEWSVRCSLEAKYHKDNCMVTLTYKPELRPKKLIKRDIQNFINKLKYDHQLDIRYFACGEYGSKAGGAHYHVILFGYWPEDAKFEYKNEKGFPVYSSKFIDSVWKRGRITISEMSPGTAFYVAGYVDKKIHDDEFVLMSKRPGIGERYFREHLFDIFAYDNIVGAFGVSKVPRYAEKLADQMFYDIDDVKEKRVAAMNRELISTMLDHGFTRKEEVLNYRSEVMEAKMKRGYKRKDL